MAAGEQPYGEGERVFAPPLYSWDTEWAVRMLLERVPGTDWTLAWSLCSAAWAELQRVGGLGETQVASAAAGLAHHAAAQSWPPALVSATLEVAVDLCRAYQVDPGGTSCA